ncbi:MAG: hypothetical protein GX605_06315, partial [Chloroflexi bacterium]|nr:hypothetical protein [Chloroflexota bacterium]
TATRTPTPTDTRVPTVTPTPTATPTTGRIVGLVYADLNRNGVADPTEPGLAEVMVRVGLADGSGTTHVVFTGPDGRYEAAGLDPGLYRVEQTVPRGYTPLSATVLMALVQSNTTAVANFADYPAAGVTLPLILQAKE